MTDTRDAIIDQQRETIARQADYIRTLEATIEGRSREGLYVVTQRRFENALMIMTCVAAIALLVVAMRYSGVDVIGWSVWFAVTLLAAIVAVGIWWKVKR